MVEQLLSLASYLVPTLVLTTSTRVSWLASLASSFCSCTMPIQDEAIELEQQHVQRQRHDSKDLDGAASVSLDLQLGKIWGRNKITKRMPRGHGVSSLELAAETSGQYKGSKKLSQIK